MPSSLSSSFWSRHSSPEPVVRFDPFLILPDHAEHIEAAEIIEVPSSGGVAKYFCPICLKSRSSEDVSLRESSEYHKFIWGLFEILDKYSETQTLRKIVLTILEVFLPKRPLELTSDVVFHQILRILYKLMRSDLHNQNEFVTISVIMSGMILKSLQPIPLRSVWEVWQSMLDYGRNVSFSDLIDQNSQMIPERLTKFRIGQATIVKSYMSLINEVAVDWTTELIFFPRRQKESVHSKYFIESQVNCQEFTRSLLLPNCECYLYRENQLDQLELRATSSVFGALRECLISAIRRQDEDFLAWLKTKDMITTIHRIFLRNRTHEYRSDLWAFLKAQTQYYIEKEYGRAIELENLIQGVKFIETEGCRIDEYDDQEIHEGAYVFYILLNWLAIKIDSRFFVSSRVRRVLTDNTRSLQNILDRFKSSKLLMRIFVFVVASSKVDLTGRSSVVNFITGYWHDIKIERTLSIFRYVYCHEPIVFEWAHRNDLFVELVNCDTISYLVDRCMSHNNLISPLKIILSFDALREVFRRYIKRNAATFFDKLSRMGANGYDRDIIDYFNGWLPPLLHEAILRSISATDRQKVIGRNLINLLDGINLLLDEFQKLKFNPFFEEQFVIDLVKLVEQKYRVCKRHCWEQEFLISANKFMALLIQTNDRCTMKLIQYIDFTLVGYMYHLLNNYKIDDSLGQAIARVLIAYNNLDYPLDHRIEITLHPISSGAYEWMMSNNSDLHALSLLLMEKLYQEPQQTFCSHRNLSNSAKACLVTGFLHMLCSHPEMLDKKAERERISHILKFEEFRYHPLSKFLLELAPQLERDINEIDGSNSSLSSLNVSFESAHDGDFDDDHMSVSRILESLNEDEGYRSASTVHLPRNIYLNRTLDNYRSETDASTDDWERRAFESTQTLQNATQNRQE